jgi:pSer/pThr/pTyr-binding forkhead associated (FHA) protein
MSENPQAWDETLTGGGQPWATLIVQQGPQPGKTYSLNKPSLTIGRSEECEVVIDDKRVSRRHAVLRWKGRELLIEDLNSANGTLVNGAPIHAPKIVQNGDVIAIGPALFGLQGVAALPSVPEGVGEKPADPTLRVPRKAARKAAREDEALLTWGGIFLLAVAVVAVLALIALLPGLLSKPPAGIPSVEIKEPRIGSQVRVGEEVVVQAVATDPNGVTRVELLVDDKLVTAVKSSASRGQTPFPATFRWTPTGQGSHTLEVRAYNAANRQNVPTSVSVKAVPVIERPSSAPAGGEPASTEPAASGATPSVGGGAMPAQPMGTIMAPAEVYTRPEEGGETVGTLREGELAVVTGRRADGSWWQIVYPPGSEGRGWVQSEYITISGDVGSIPLIPDTALP